MVDSTFRLSSTIPILDEVFVKLGSALKMALDGSLYLIGMFDFGETIGYITMGLLKTRLFGLSRKDRGIYTSVAEMVLPDGSWNRNAFAELLPSSCLLQV